MKNMNNIFSVKDFYCVYNDYDISEYSKELNLLYLPLLGNDAISLYNFLGSKMLSDKNLSKNYLHYDILDNLALSNHKFIVARKKLEAIGLLQTFYIDNNGVGQFVYKIKQALNFSQFFGTPVLAQLLENTIGTVEYKELSNYYSLDKVSFRSFEEITSKFSDVFHLENLNDFGFDYLENKVTSGPNFDEYYFDFDKLNYYLANSYLTEVISNDEVKNKILGLAHIYKMDSQDMAKAIEKSVEITNGASEINLKVLTDYIVQLNVNVRKQEVPTLERMVNKNLANIEGQTALMILCKTVYRDGIDYIIELLENGADVGSIDKNGYTVLMYTALNTESGVALEIAKLLHDFGDIKISYVNNDGQSAVDITVENNNENLVNWLLTKI